LRPFLARSSLRIPVSVRRYRLQVAFGAPVSGGENPDSKRAGRSQVLCDRRRRVLRGAHALRARYSLSSPASIRASVAAMLIRPRSKLDVALKLLLVGAHQIAPAAGLRPSMPAGSRPFVNPGAGEAGAGGVGYMRARTLHLLAVAADELICPVPCRTDYRRINLVIRSLAKKLPRDKERGSREIAALQEEKLHHRVLIQRTRGLIHTVKFVSKPRPGTCVAFAFGLSNDLRITGTSGARNRRSLMRRVRFRP